MFVDTPAPTKFNVLLYGPAKAGKSTGAASAEGPTMWINFQGEGSLGYARQHAARRGTAIHEVRVHTDDDPREVLRQVVAHIRSGAEPVVRTVVIDTVGNLRDHLVKRMVQKGSRNSLSQYGDVAEVLRDTILDLRDAPVNLVLICHEDIKDGQGDEPRIVQPLIGGKTTGDVLAEVDVIAYCTTMPAPDDDDRDVLYVAQLVEGRGRRAGDRSGALGSWRELDLTEWWGVYRDALTPESPFDDPTDVDEDLQERLVRETFGVEEPA